MIALVISNCLQGSLTQAIRTVDGKAHKNDIGVRIGERS